MIFLWCYVLRCRMCLWCYSECISTLDKLKNLPDHGGNRTRDLWFASPMLCQLSYEVKSVQVCDISELSLVPSISVCLYLRFFMEFRNITCSNRRDLVAHLAEHWTRKPKVAGSIPTVVRQIFQLPRCG